MNLFSVMVKNRFKNEDDEDFDDPDKPKGKKGGSKKKEKGSEKMGLKSYKIHSSGNDVLVGD